MSFNLKEKEKELKERKRRCQWWSR